MRRVWLTLSHLTSSNCCQLTSTTDNTFHRQVDRLIDFRSRILTFDLWPEISKVQAPQRHPVGKKSPFALINPQREVTTHRAHLLLTFCSYVDFYFNDRRSTCTDYKWKKYRLENCRLGFWLRSSLPPIVNRFCSHLAPQYSSLDLDLSLRLAFEMQNMSQPGTITM